MSQHRINPEAGWDRGDGPRGPNGRRLCRRCGVEVPKGQRTFCGAACIHEWKLRSDPGYVRRKVLERDRGVCAACGVKSEWQADHIVEVVKGGGQCGLENYQTLCTPCHKVKTRRLVRERAEQRKIAAEQAKMSLFAGIES